MASSNDKKRECDDSWTVDNIALSTRKRSRRSPSSTGTANSQPTSEEVQAKWRAYMDKKKETVERIKSRLRKVRRKATARSIQGVIFSNFNRPIDMPDKLTNQTRLDLIEKLSQRLDEKERRSNEDCDAMMAAMNGRTTGRPVLIPDDDGYR